MDPEAMTIWLPTLVLVVARLAGLFLVAPGFSHSAVPIRLRYFLSVATALAVLGRIAQPVALPTNWLDAVGGVACEAAVGAAIGYAARLVLAGVQLGALQIGQQMGVALGAVLDPTSGEPSGVVRRMFQILAVVIFLAIGGHRMLVASVLKTFQVVPLAGFAPGEAMLDMAVALLGASFVLALKVAAPVLVALLGATVAMAMIQRTVPQCNILSVGFPMRVLLGLLVLALSLGALGELIEVLLTRAVTDAATAVG